MPVQIGNFKISACPDLATQLLQFLIPTIFGSRLCQKGNVHISHVLEDDLLRKYLVITPNVKIINYKILEIFACPKIRFSGNCLSKRQVVRIFAKLIFY